MGTFVLAGLEAYNCPWSVSVSCLLFIFVRCRIYPMETLRLSYPSPLDIPVSLSWPSATSDSLRASAMTPATHFTFCLLPSKVCATHSVSAYGIGNDFIPSSHSKYRCAASSSSEVGTSHL